MNDPIKSIDEALKILDKLETTLMFMIPVINENMDTKFSIRDLLDKEKRSLVKSIIEKLEKQ